MVFLNPSAMNNGEAQPSHYSWHAHGIWKPSLKHYRVYKKKRNLGISQEIDIVLKTKDFRRLEF
jgi:hypothetical protein